MESARGGVRWVDDVKGLVERKLARTGSAAWIWGDDPDEAYPVAIPLNVGRSTLQRLGARGREKWLEEWKLAVEGGGCTLMFEKKSINPSIPSVSVPIRVSIPSEEDALAFVGGDASKEAEKRAARRRIYSKYGFPLECREKVLRETRGYEDKELGCLFEWAAWARGKRLANLSPRQVPVPGIQGKLLDGEKNKRIVRMLVGREALNLAPPAQFVELKYLDPSSSASYGLCRDGWRDEGRPAYPVDVAIVVENKETFSDFPDEVLGGVCILGSGYAAAKRIAGITWLRSVPKVVYWGDMDTDGLEILAQVRAGGIECESILMDSTAFHEFENLGSSTARKGGAIKLPDSIPPEVEEYLEEGELELYKLLVGGQTLYPRIEQEKIPYDFCLDALEAKGVDTARKQLKPFQTGYRKE